MLLLTRPISTLAKFLLSYPISIQLSAFDPGKIIFQTKNKYNASQFIETFIRFQQIKNMNKQFLIFEFFGIYYLNNKYRTDNCNTVHVDYAECTDFKGSVSRDLRWVLLYINGKLSLRPFISSQKILSLLTL